MRPGLKITVITICAVAGVGITTWILARSSSGAHSEPIGPGPESSSSGSIASPADLSSFLSGNFAIIKDVKSLPQPVLQLFTEINGSRYLLANPGQKFNASDVVDTTLPGKRLIFAGVFQDKCFVHYEQGGRGLWYVLALYKLAAPDRAILVSRLSCGPASTLADLRNKIQSGDCTQTAP